MERPEAKSFKQLTISVEKLPASMARDARLSQYAADRARLLLGCYRKGEANDPETYVAAIAATLARYPEEVITSVTHPASGLPSRSSWLPTVKEVHDACEEAFYPIHQQQLREKRIKDQLAAREQDDRSVRPTLDQLKAKYGPNWGLTPANPEKGAEAKAAENKRAIERAQARVRAEYLHLGKEPPSPLALSPTALKVMADVDAERNRALSVDMPAQPSEEAAE